MSAVSISQRHSSRPVLRLLNRPATYVRRTTQSFLGSNPGRHSASTKLQGVTNPDAYVAIAKDAGFMTSADELRKAQSIVFQMW